MTLNSAKHHFQVLPEFSGPVWKNPIEVPILIISHSLINIQYDHFQDWACGNLAGCKRNVERSDAIISMCSMPCSFCGFMEGSESWAGKVSRALHGGAPAATASIWL